MKPQVFYNDECIICRFEINHYKKKSVSLEWKGIHSIKKIENIINKKPSQLIRRLHVKDEDKILVGIDAFIYIWSKISGYKYLSKIIRFPFFYYLALVVYEILAFALYLKNYHQIKKLSK